MICPTPELLAAMAEEKISPTERETLLLHISDCAACRRTMLLLSAERGTVRRPAISRSNFPWGAVAAAMLIGLTAFLIWKIQPSSPISPVAVAPTPTPRQEPAPSGIPVPPPPPGAPSPPPPSPPSPPSPTRVPAPPDPEPTQAPPTPVPTTIPDPPKPVPTTQPAPRREIVAVRILDISGELISAKKKVLEGTLTTAALAANSPAAFRIKDDLVAMTKGTVATVGRSGGSLAIVVESGEACVESQGSSWLLGDQEVVLRGRALVSNAGVVLVADLPEKEAARRTAPFKNVRPRQRTWIFEDFADKPAGILTAVPDGPVLRAEIPLGQPIPWSRKFSVQLRYRTTASSLAVQLGIPTDGQPTAWVAMNQTSKGWQELTIPAARFENPLVDFKEPPAGSRIVGLSFIISLDDAAKGKALLEIDDIILVERE